MCKTHDVHGLHGLMKVVFVLLSWDWDVAIRQETVFVKSFQKQIGCGMKYVENKLINQFIHSFIKKKKKLYFYIYYKKLIKNIHNNRDKLWSETSEIFLRKTKCIC